MKTTLQIIALMLTFAACYWFGRSSVEITTTETIRVDTVFYEKPQPVRVLPPTFVTVRVPRLLFAPGDTVVRGVSGADSVDVQVAVERKQYSDSTYRAQISGPTVGNLHPALDWIEVYNRTNTVAQTITKRSRFAVTAGAGVAYTPRGFQPYAGIGVGVILWQW